MTTSPPPRGLFEMVLEVSDLERSISFYRDVLGLAEVLRWDEPRPAQWLSMGPHQVLGLWPKRSGGPGVGVAGSRGGAHVHFAVLIEPGTLDAWLERLRGHGLAVEEPQEFAAGKNRSIYVDDPDGNVVELADWSIDWSGVPIDPRAPAP